MLSAENSFGIRRIRWNGAGACALCFVLALFLGFSRSDARPLQLQDLRRELSISTDQAPPEISSDGKLVAYVLSTPNFSTNNDDERIQLIEASSGRERTLVTNVSGVRNLRWAPGNGRIAFIGSASGQDSEQLFILDIQTGGRRTITSAGDGVHDFAWRPDGKEIAFSGSNKRSAKRGDRRFLTAFEVGDNDYLATEAPLPSHLWGVAVSGGPPVRLSPPSVNIPKEAPIIPQHVPNDFFSWSPDGRKIALTRAPNAYTADDDRDVVEMLDLKSGTLRKLTSHHGLESGGEFSPDGSRVAYWYPRNGNPIGGSDIYVTSPRGGDGRPITARLDRSALLAEWMPDSKSLLVLAHDRTRESMWVVDMQGSYTRLDTGELSVSAASVSRNGAIAFVASGPQSPSELFILKSVHAQPHRLTHINAYFSKLHLGKVQSLEWQGPDGFTEDGVLTYPPGFIAGARYPLVLQIHGWPAYASQEAFDTDYSGLTQLLAAHGYVVFEPNYRGSDNLGNAYQIALLGDTVAGPARDIMAGIAAVEKLGIVDAGRIGVSGWSYGGLMTGWLISHESVFKAAMVGAAPTDNLPDYALSNYNVLDRHYYGGSPWASKKLWQTYVDQSIMPFAWNITAPTLIMCDTSDTTVPITHSYELFHALRDRGVTVSFIAYVSSAHFPVDPIDREDVYRRWVGWFDRYLR